MFAYDAGVLPLSSSEVLTILAQRLERRAQELERVRLPGFEVAIDELRRFAQMAIGARRYLETGVSQRPSPK